ncbi:MAG: aminoacyl-tRNA hydrolase [Gammaproteobacteria bacterium]
MNTPIHLIVGLGNPGPEYEQTRHNAGVWFLQQLADQYQQTFHFEKKFHGQCARINVDNHDCHLLIPETFMNHSGKAVQAISQFYKIAPENILIVHDELDLQTGTIRLKFDGGHGGHNGLRDIIAHLSTPKFHRLRIGIGHPGSSKHVLDYVLKAPNRADHQLIMDAISDALVITSNILAGEMQKAMHQLHSD